MRDLKIEELEHISGGAAGSTDHTVWDEDEAVVISVSEHPSGGVQTITYNGVGTTTNVCGSCSIGDSNGEGGWGSYSTVGYNFGTIGATGGYFQTNTSDGETIWGWQAGVGVPGVDFEGGVVLTGDPLLGFGFQTGAGLSTTVGADGEGYAAGVGSHVGAVVTYGWSPSGN